MIEVQNLTKIYGKKANIFTALDSVSFSVPTAATVAIIGKSGSGKSTLMHVMSGLDRPTRGSITIDGRHLHALSKKDIDRFRSLEMSFIFQAFFVEGNQTVYQNVALPLEIAKVPARKRKKLVKSALGLVELEEKIHNKAKDLSGGQKQRLAIARAIVNRPKIIFADEPTGNLDSVTGETIINLLFGLNRSLGCTLIIVTHDAELARRCQMQVILKDGKVERIFAAKGMEVSKTVPIPEQRTAAAPKVPALAPRLPQRPKNTDHDELPAPQKVSSKLKYAPQIKPPKKGPRYVS